MAQGARSVVARAYEEARRDGSPEIDEGHLFQALLADGEGRTLLVDVAGDVERAQIQAELDQARGRGGLTATETEALAGWGIDVDAVVRQIEEQGGAKAEADSGSRSPGRWRPAISSSALLVLEEAEQHLRATGGRSLRVEHLVLGLVSGARVLSESLARRGITLVTVRAAARGGGRE